MGNILNTARSVLRESELVGPAASVRRITLGSLTPAELFERLSGPGQEPAILGEIISAMYWGGRKEIGLQQVAFYVCPFASL